MNRLTVSRSFATLAAAILTFTRRAEAKVVGFHIRQLRQAKAAKHEAVIEAGKQHYKFEQDQFYRKEEIDAATRRAKWELERKRHEAAVFNVAVSAEIHKYGHVA